jgi:hypothetical protein
MTTEGIDEPLRALEDACRARNIPPSRFRTLPFGESVRLWGDRSSPRLLNPKNNHPVGNE